MSLYLSLVPYVMLIADGATGITLPPWTTTFFHRVISFVLALEEDIRNEEMLMSSLESVMVGRW